jgi:hypothetical protein
VVKLSGLDADAGYDVSFSNIVRHEIVRAFHAAVDVGSIVTCSRTIIPVAQREAGPATQYPNSQDHHA